MKEVASDDLTQLNAVQMIPTQLLSTKPGAVHYSDDDNDPDTQATLDRPHLLERMKNLKDTIISDPSRFDAVVIAIPPSELLDPISAAMAGGGWDYLLQAAAEAPIETDDGPLLGIPFDQQLLETQPLTLPSYASTSAFRKLTETWELIRFYIKAMRDEGVVTVVPAGDYGDGPQKIMGLANLPEVVTAGGFNPQGMISTSSVQGPSIDLVTKPDLLAPTGVVGIMGKDSTLGKFLEDNGALNSSLSPSWSELPTETILLETKRVKARLDTTLSAAAVVATSLGALRKQGVADPETQKATLYASSAPIASVPSYRQGRGVLGGPSQNISIPTTTATTAALIASHGDLGMEPDQGTWKIEIPILQGDALAVTLTYEDFLGVDVLGETTATATNSDLAPTATATVTSTTVTVEVDPDDEEPGFYSGYLDISVVASSVTTTATVPFSLVKGFRPVAHSLYIHDLSTTGTSFSLAPALPPGAGLLERALAKIPVSPLDTTFEFAGTKVADCLRYGVGSYVTGTTEINDDCAGHGRFRPVPPGFYWVRAWTDYSAPITYKVTGSTTNVEEVRNPHPRGDISYSQFKTLLLPRARYFDDVENEVIECVESYGPFDDWSGHHPTETAVSGWPKMWKSCTQDALNARIDSEATDPLPPWVPDIESPVSTRYEGPTGGFLLEDDQGLLSDSWGKPDVFRINLGYLRRAAAGNIVSRYIDIISKPCEELRFLSFQSPQVFTVTGLVNAAAGDPFWSSGCDGAETLLATRAGSGSSAGQIALGRASYPISLTQPNFYTNFDLNFAYEVVNAAILVIVNIGGDAGVGIVTGEGAIQLPPKGVNDEIDLVEIATGGTRQGEVNFNFNLLSENFPTGTVNFFFLPYKTNEILGAHLLPSWAAIRSNAEVTQTLSFKVETSTPWGWPGIIFPIRGKNPPPKPWENCLDEVLVDAGVMPNECGHTFSFTSSLSAWTATPSGTYQSGQVKDDECRMIDNGIEEARVCEDWAVLAHLPRAPVEGEFGYEVTRTWASLMDILDASSATITSYTSVMDELKDAGGVIYSPTSTATAAARTAGVLLMFSGSEEDGHALAETLGAMVTTTSRYFEQLYFPMEFLSDYPGKIEVCINDEDPRWVATTTATIKSICTGSYVNNSWVSATTYVPCLPRVPPHPDQDQASELCASDPDSGKRAKVAPYVPYITSSRLLL